MRDLIFLGGIHGVGKSTFCNDLSAHFSFDHVCASAIIKHAEMSKQITDIQKNQDLLVIGLNEYKRTNPVIILDGHFCLLDSDNKFVKVPLDTFHSLSPKFLLLLLLDPKIISKRISTRDQNTFSPDFLEAFQTAELEHAKFVSKSLKVPLMKINSLEFDAFTSLEQYFLYCRSSEEECH